MLCSIITVFVALIFCIIIDGNEQKYRDEPCTFDNGEIGICKQITDCDTAMNQLRESGQAPKTCSFEKEMPIVCCQKPNVIEKINSGRICQQKCEEHEKIKFFAGYVVGGKYASSKEFPHMAVLGYGEEGSKEWKCGGSLISNEFVLTAAHCLYSREFGFVRWVRLGDLNIRTDKDLAQPQDFWIKNAHSHPEFKPPSRYNDIALVRLDHPAAYTEYVRPACLHCSFQLPQSPDPIATGWGKTEFVGEVSDDLMKVDLVYYNNSECGKHFVGLGERQLGVGIDDQTQLCAGGVGEAKDTCSGDSGGPLQVVYKEKVNLYKIVGVTSFGKACGIINVPGVYTRVSNYVDWIEPIVWPGQ